MNESEPTQSTSIEPQVAEAHANLPNANNPPSPTPPLVEPRGPNIPAWIAAFATVGMLIATSVNVLINKWQGDTMEVSLQAAQTAATAAGKAANIAERALSAGQRAFVAFLTLNHAATINYKTNKVMQWSFVPTWRNAGNTPTRNLVTHDSLMIFDGEMPKDWDFPDIWAQQSIPEERVPTPLGISPQHTIFGEALGVPIEVMEDVIAHKKSLYMWGWTAYSDIFPETKRHITRFAVQIFIGGNPHDIKRISFSYPFINQYNCSDEECDHQGYPASWNAKSLTPEDLPIVK